MPDAFVYRLFRMRFVSRLLYADTRLMLLRFISPSPILRRRASGTATANTFALYSAMPAMSLTPLSLPPLDTPLPSIADYFAFFLLSIVSPLRLYCLMPRNIFSSLRHAAHVMYVADAAAMPRHDMPLCLMLLLPPRCLCVDVSLRAAFDAPRPPCRFSAAADYALMIPCYAASHY